MSMELAMALLAFSAPVTAAIWTRTPREGSGVTKEEFVTFSQQINKRLDSLQQDVRELRRVVNEII